MTSTDNEHAQDSTETMADLAAAAVAQQPRLFTVYGVLREIDGVDGEEPFLGWGMDLGDDDGALYWDPSDNSTHRSNSAEQVLRFHQRIGQAHLDWLDEP